MRTSLLLLACAACAVAAADPQSEELLELAARVHGDGNLGGANLPTVVLVGHQNAGKSSLLEALLGIKLTHVGNEGLTRRPLQITAQRDDSAAEPALFLTRDGSGGGEEQVRPEQLRSLIERENARLEAAGEYEAEPLRVRLSWRRAPTLVLIDTPGLIGPADGLELGEAAAAVEGLVLQHLTPPKRLILCLEDTSDWAISRTMAGVSRADTDLRRTLLVGTKLDAKMAQAAQH